MVVDEELPVLAPEVVDAALPVEDEPVAAVEASLVEVFVKTVAEEEMLLMDVMGVSKKEG